MTTALASARRTALAVVRQWGGVALASALDVADDDTRALLTASDELGREELLLCAPVATALQALDDACWAVIVARRTAVAS